MVVPGRRDAAVVGAVDSNPISCSPDDLELIRLRRLTGRGPKTTLTLALDQWTSLVRGRDAGRLLDLLEDIAHQGSKYLVTLLLSAHSWSAEAIG